ncbi:MAG: hypothetical protein F6K58_23115 [Symploca sp. SIO2E9]|nr:hypothetical protein [Symploca sp. SIO2E9]
MRAFHMNLLKYNANTQFTAGGNPTQKQLALHREMLNYHNNVLPQGANVNLAGFTEVLVADGAAQQNVQQALNNLGNALGIPAGNNNLGRHIAVIRCGRSVIQDSNEVVAIVVDGNAVINHFGLLYFTSVGPINWVNQQINPANNRYTSHLQIPHGAIPDYRYIVYVNFTLNNNQYSVGFIHNRAPGTGQATTVMLAIRNLLEAQNPLITICGGDFNTPALAINNAGVGVQYPPPPNAHHPLWYYSPGNTTVANAFDYWISFNQFFNPNQLQQTAVCNCTPNNPNQNLTGSDHRGVGIDI